MSEMYYRCLAATCPGHATPYAVCWSQSEWIKHVFTNTTKQGLTEDDVRRIVREGLEKRK